MRVGMLTSGGDCQSLNATMRGVAKTLYNQRKDVEIIGFIEGYRGLIYEDYRIMKSKDFSGILTNGGTILGTSRQPFKLMRVPDENGLDKVEAMKNTYKKLKLDCLVVLGGNGSQKTTNLLRQEGLNVIGLPKTIDNDLWGTDVTFGFQSAINLATQTIDCIHTTAASHGRVFIVEIMGHKVGWLTLHAGIAGGADIILVPEIPYDINKVAAAVNKRAKEGKRFSIIAVAEGAISKEQAALSKKEYKKYIAENDVKYKILLLHEPDTIDNLSERFDLILAGHSHNGQVRLPLIGATILPDGAKRYYEEHYTINNTELFISSGLGTSSLPLRFMNHPSINFYRINKKS